MPPSVLASRSGRVGWRAKDNRQVWKDFGAVKVNDLDFVANRINLSIVAVEVDRLSRLQPIWHAISDPNYIVDIEDVDSVPRERWNQEMVLGGLAIQKSSERGGPTQDLIRAELCDCCLPHIRQWGIISNAEAERADEFPSVFGGQRERLSVLGLGTNGSASS